MTKMEAALPQYYRDMHAKDLFANGDWPGHVIELKGFAPHGGILDYGCGPSGGLALHFPDAISYDPYIPKFAEDPWDKDFRSIFSCDVMEHMTLDQLTSFAERLVAKRELRLVYLVISTRKANKSFPNGVNVHLTVETPQWWKGFLEGRLGSVFEMTRADADMIRQEVTFVFLRRHVTV